MRYFTACALLILLACAPSEETKTPEPAPAETSVAVDDRTYVPGERIGAITAGMTVAEARRVYGEDQVVAATLYGAEGITYEGYHLFPGTDDQLALATEEDSVIHSADTYDPGSRWASAQTGVRIGTSLATLNRLNGRPFDFSGFGWDYGGMVTDWKGGALAGHRLRLEPGHFIDPEQMMPFAGDAIFSSDDPKLAELDIRVDHLYLGIGE